MNLLMNVGLLSLMGTGILAQFKCPPERTGYFPDPNQCDLYYECSKGEFEEKLCPDGLVFDDKDPNIGRCDIPANINCDGRPDLQTAKPSEGCPRKNGYYRHPDPEVCDKFYNCVDGKPIELPCPPGLVYDDIASTCAWRSNSKRQDCLIVSKRVSLDDGFTCPKEDVQQSGMKIPHPTYANPDDCQKFYICRDGLTPQKGSCSYGMVYNEVTMKCDEPVNVPGCEDFFDKLEKKENTKTVKKP